MNPGTDLNQEEAYHFVGFTTAHRGWIGVVQSVFRIEDEYAEVDGAGGVVRDRFCGLSDQLELLKSERIT